MIDEKMARRAKEMNSFYDYEEGQATREFEAACQSAEELAEERKKCVSSEYHEKIDSLLQRYKKLLEKNANDYYRIECMCPSFLITGAGNFPVARKEKQNRAREKNYREREALNSLLDKIATVGAEYCISSDSSTAVQELTAKVEALEAEKIKMKHVNAYHHLKGTVIGCPYLTEEEALEMADCMTRSTWGMPYPGFKFTNLGARLRSARKRLDQLKKRDELTLEGWDFPGGKVVLNKEENRVQLLYDEKPSAEVISNLKHHGFRWSPRFKAWQRMLNGNGMYAAGKITGRLK